MNRNLVFSKFLPSFFTLLFVLAALPVQADNRSLSYSSNTIIISVSDLPPEARDTLKLIKQGGPFPYPRDGVEFGNYERLLPQQSRARYREYTVKTPGIRHRGARRIVCGVVPECYYTENHYRSFRRITEGR